MRLIGLMPLRNEEWVLGLSARVALRWCDHLVCLAHASTDRSEEILRDLSLEHPGRLSLLTWHDPEWDEMGQRQSMLTEARRLKASHIAMIDADEILCAVSLPVIRRRIEELPPRVMLAPRLYNLRGSPGRYHSDGLWGNRVVSLAFEDCPHARWEGDRFHHREPCGIQWRISPCPEGIMHLRGASEERLIAKHRLYRIVERLRWPAKRSAAIEAEYDGATRRVASWHFSEVPGTWWGDYDLSALHVNDPPWQAAEADRLIAAHGLAKFNGLKVRREDFI